MADIEPLSSGDRVTVDGLDGVFLVLSVDAETQSASLLPIDHGPTLNDVPLESVNYVGGPGIGS